MINQQLYWFSFVWQNHTQFTQKAILHKSRATNNRSIRSVRLTPPWQMEDVCVSYVLDETKKSQQKYALIEIIAKL